MSEKIEQEHGYDFATLKDLARKHGADVRLRVPGGRIIDVIRDELGSDELLADSNDNHDRVVTHNDGHEKVTSVHDKTPQHPNQNMMSDVDAKNGVFLAGVDDVTLARLQAAARDLLMRAGENPQTDERPQLH